MACGGQVVLSLARVDNFGNFLITYSNTTSGIYVSEAEAEAEAEAESSKKPKKIVLSIQDPLPSGRTKMPVMLHVLRTIAAQIK